MGVRARKSAAYSIRFLVFCAILIWAVPPRVSPAASPAQARQDGQEAAAARHERPLELPAALPPTGGPYVDAESIRVSGLRQALGRRAVNPQAESVRFMTYGEAVDWYRTGWSPTIDLYREVYVVSVPGRITVGHHVQLSYARSYYIYDASTGQLVQWGATDNPDPVTEGRAPRP
jgi:hypothetical protein